MKVILLTDVKKVGIRGALVDVADGYAQNVLIPKKLALPATRENIGKWEREQKEKKDKSATDQESAAKLLSELKGKGIELKARANPSGGLFEAIREKQITDAIQAQLGVSLHADNVDLAEPIKKLGEAEAKISLHGMEAQLLVTVVRL